MRMPLLVSALLLLGCAAELPSTITEGLWMADGEPETFYWELFPEGGGVIHTMREGRKETELPISRVVWEPPNLTLEMDATGTSYVGEVDLASGRVRGAVHYGGEQGPEMELRWVAEAPPGLRAMSGDYVYTVPVSGGGWETSDCAEQGIPHQAVEDMVAAIRRGEAGVLHSMLLVKDGKLIVEEYFHGYGADDTHRLASVTKSVSALLVGLAVDAGEIEGVDAPLLQFFPGLETSDSPHWQDMTLRHLLTMSMGLDWDADGGPHGTGPEHFARIFGRQVVHEPGTRWAYHSANVNLIAGVLLAASGLHADEFAEERLFAPLGIADYDWSYGAHDGYRLMDGSLRLRPRDMAKLGMLVRDGGMWRGKRVISAGWMRDCTRAQIATDGPEGYGYLWWIGELPLASGSRRAIFANGHGSQFILWLPELDLLAVITGGNEDNGKHFAPGAVVARYVLARMR